MMINPKSICLRHLFAALMLALFAFAMLPNTASAASVCDGHTDLPGPLIDSVVHTVGAGETLSEIADCHNISMSVILDANPGVTNPDILRVGQQLVLGESGCAPHYDPPSIGPNIQHTVVAGDTLYQIARCHGVTIAGLESVNYLPNLNHIFVGQQLLIPVDGLDLSINECRISHTVQFGDTLSEIADRYDAALHIVASANSIIGVNLIHPGQEICIP